MWRSAGGVVLLLVAIAGCGVIGPRQLTLTLPADKQHDALPVSFTDLTGKVSHLEAVPRGVEFPAFEDGVQPFPRRSTAVVLNWTGGACDERASITLAERDGIGTFVVETVRPPGACILIAFGRRIVVNFKSSVDVTTLRVEEVR